MKDRARHDIGRAQALTITNGNRIHFSGFRFHYVVDDSGISSPCSSFLKVRR